MNWLDCSQKWRLKRNIKKKNFLYAKTERNVHTHTVIRNIASICCKCMSVSVFFSFLQRNRKRKHKQYTQYAHVCIMYIPSHFSAIEYVYILFRVRLLKPYIRRGEHFNLDQSVVVLSGASNVSFIKFLIPFFR